MTRDELIADLSSRLLGIFPATRCSRHAPLYGPDRSVARPDDCQPCEQSAGLLVEWAIEALIGHGWVRSHGSTQGAIGALAAENNRLAFRVATLAAEIRRLKGEPEGGERAAATSPDCAARKCSACTGDGDIDADGRLIPCSCVCHAQAGGDQ